MPTIKFDLSPEKIDKEPQRNARLPRLTPEEKSFLGWRRPDGDGAPFMNFIEDTDITLRAAVTDGPTYIVESHYRGDVNDYTGPRCQYRRYVVDVYLENVCASSGAFRLDVCNDFLYYLGHVPVEGIALAVDAPSRTFEGQYHFEADNFRIMLYFSRYGLGYSEIAARTSDEALKADRAYALADSRPAEISANFYIGVQDEETSAAEDFAGCMSVEPSCTEDDGEVISRFALMSDSHVGRRYQWANYDWLHSAFDHIAEIHKKNAAGLRAPAGRQHRRRLCRVLSERLSRLS